jgi:hypothetical protein
VPAGPVVTIQERHLRLLHEMDRAHAHRRVTVATRRITPA